MIPIIKRPKIPVGRPTLYPFSKLKVGEGFTVNTPSYHKIHSIRCCSRYWKKKLGHTYTTEIFSSGITIWRTA